MTDIKQHIIPLGPVLVIMIGPHGAGKYALSCSKFESNQIVDATAIRYQLLGHQIRFDKDQMIVDEIYRQVESKLRAGGVAVVCDTNLKAKRRLSLKTLGAKYNAKLIYLVVDRNNKVSTNVVAPRGDELDMVKITHDIFYKYEQVILGGDSDKSVTVIDARAEEFTVIQPLPRDSRRPLLDELKSRGYNLVRVIPDVHGNYAGLVSVLGTVRSDMFLVFLGDIMDYGDGSWSCMNLIHELVVTGRAIMLRGNHDRKIARFVEQNLSGESFSGKVTHGMQVTVKQWDSQSMKSQTVIGNKFLSLLDHSPDWIQCGSWMMAHAAIDKRMVDNQQFRATKNSTLEKMALYGETDGTVDGDGKPNRTYRWVDRMPPNYSAVVGHQIMSVESPVIRKTPSDEQLVFLDTGSSKSVSGVDGQLSYVDFDITLDGIGFDLTIKGFGNE